MRSLLLEADLQDIDFKRALWSLAFEAHRAGGSADDETTADITQAALLRTLRGIHSRRSLDWAEAVVQQIKERNGFARNSREHKGPRVEAPQFTFQWE